MLLLTIVCALIVGVVLGLLGAGGSVILVPILVYLLRHSVDASVAESLGIVCVISFFTSFSNFRNKLIDWPNVFFFGAPAMIGMVGGAWLGAHVVAESAKIIGLALIMLVSVVLMLRKREVPKIENNQPEEIRLDAKRILKIVAQGVGVGVLTGIVGVGGGFVIIPALVILGGLPMRTAVGTSLVIIAMNSSVGFFQYRLAFLNTETIIDYNTVVLVSIFGVAGSFIGMRFGKNLPQATLRKGFAYLLLGIAIFMISERLMFNNPAEGDPIEHESTAQVVPNNIPFVRQSSVCPTISCTL